MTMTRMITCYKIDQERLCTCIVSSPRSGMLHRLATYFVALVAIFAQAAGELLITPRDTESKVGDTTYFNCSTNLTSKEILWNHGDRYVYSEDGILHPYDERFEIDRNASIGSYNLVIHSVNQSDAGEYICIDDDGHGTRRSAQLVVLENDPDCQSNIQPDGVIGQNVFNIAPDEVQLTCTVNYHGNIFPQMEWKNVEDNDSTNGNVTFHVRSDNRIIYTLNLKGDMSLDNSSYVCQTKRSAHDQYKCYSKAIQILYFVSRNMTEQNAFRGEEITCIAGNNTFNCSSQWYHDNYNTCPLSCEKAIKTHLLGEYLCMVKCYIRGTDYPPFTVLKAVVAEAPTSPPPSTTGTMIAAVVILIVSIILVVLVGVCIVRYRIRKHERLLAQKKAYYKKLQNEENQAELVFKIKKEDKAIRGMAILGRKLFVMHEKSSHFQIYNRDDFKVASKLLRVKDVVAAFDICSCKLNNWLYVMDEEDLDCNDKDKSEARKVVKISEDGRILGKWSTNACGFLSATKEGHVIITSRDNHKLLEYDSDGILFRSIDLKGCTRPWHTIKLDKDRYVVSHGTFENLNRVCIVNENGIVINAFGGEMGSAEDQLHIIPYYLAVGYNDCVLVADFCNDRVLLLDSKLVFKTIIVPKFKQGFRNPRRVYLDEGLLVVVIGAGIPRNILFVEQLGIEKETESVARLKENDDSEKTIHIDVHDKERETEEGIALKMIEEQKEISVVEETELQGNSYRETEKRKQRNSASLVEKGTHGEALFSEKKTEEGDTVKVITEHKETNEYTEESEFDEGIDDWWRKHTIKVNVLKVIEKDCTLLVFDIKLLLKKYND